MPEPTIPTWQADILRAVERARASGRRLTVTQARGNVARERRRLRIEATTISLLSRVMAGEDVTLTSGTKEEAAEIMERVRSLIPRMPFCLACSRDFATERTPCEHCEDL